MTQEQIEVNFLISVFNEWTYKNVKHFISDISSVELHNYHEDWNKLMRVVEKIEKLGYVTEIMGLWNKNYTYSFSITQIGNKSIQFGRGISDETKIEAVYFGVVEFIKWYNQTKQL